MANINMAIPQLLKWEGTTFVNDKDDHGGATRYGVTLATWQKLGYDKNNDGKIDAEDVKLLNQNDANYVVKKFWDRIQGDKINNQSIANLILQWHWGSGYAAFPRIQKILGTTTNKNKLTDTDILKINDSDPETMFNKIWTGRKQHFDDIVAHDATQKKWYNGWMNRLNSYKYEPEKKKIMNELNNEENPNKKRNIILISVASVLVLAAIITTIIIIVKKRKK